MGLPANMWIKDNSGQLIVGGCKTQGRQHSITVQSIDHAIHLPYDSDSGKIQSERKHSPFGVLKHIDQSTPILHKMCCNGANLTQVKVDFYRINDEGGEESYYTILLEQAKVVSISPIISSFSESADMEQVNFAYNTIQWLYHEGHIEAKDDRLKRM